MPEQIGGLFEADVQLLTGEEPYEGQTILDLAVEVRENPHSGELEASVELPWGGTVMSRSIHDVIRQVADTVEAGP